MLAHVLTLTIPCVIVMNIWTMSSKFGTYRLCEQRRFRRACASAQSRQNLRCSLIQAVNQEEPSDRKPDPWPLWMAGHAELKFVMTECSKTQIRLTGLIWYKGSIPRPLMLSLTPPHRNWIIRMHQTVRLALITENDFHIAPWHVLIILDIL